MLLQDSSGGSPSLSSNNGDSIEPLTGLETILEELLQEDGYSSSRYHFIIWKTKKEEVVYCSLCIANIALAYNSRIMTRMTKIGLVWMCN